MKLSKNLAVFIFVFFSVFFFAQDKKKFISMHNVMSKIIPNDAFDFWVLVHNNYGKNSEIKVSGRSTGYIPQFSGFNLAPGNESNDAFFYIVYSKGKNISYITDLKNLKSFIGNIDNAEEAVIFAIFEGYIIDEEFGDYAANYYEDKKNYYLDLGKVTSKECPYQKKHFTLTLSKSTGEITNVKENGSYIELYNKKCTNNPRLLKTEKKEEPKDDPKKKPLKKRN